MNAPLPADELWVFGYGSLMWNPGFSYIERHLGRITGYHRALCIYSHVHRGTPDNPGLVLGLDRGGSCQGYAFRVAAPQAEETLAYLREREQVTSIYLERHLAVRLGDGRTVTAVAYVTDRLHQQYAGRLSREETLAHVRRGEGRSGPNPDYVLATQDHLAELGIHDPMLQWLAQELRPTPGAQLTPA